MQNTITQQSTRAWKRGAADNTVDGSQAKGALDMVNQFADGFVAEARAADNTEADLNAAPGRVATESPQGNLEGSVSWDKFNLTRTTTDLNGNVEQMQIWKRPTAEGTQIVMNVSTPGDEFSQYTTRTLNLDASGNIMEFEQTFVERQH